MARNDVYIYTEATDPADAVITAQQTTTAATFPTLVLGDTPLFNFYFTDGTASWPLWAGHPDYSVSWAISDAIAGDDPPYALQTDSSAITGGWSIRLPLNAGALINALQAKNVSQAWPVVQLWQHIRVTDANGYVVSYALLRTNVRLRVMGETQVAPDDPLPSGTRALLVDSSGALVSPTNFFAVNDLVPLIKGYQTIAALTAVDVSSVTTGQKVFVSGYSSSGDGGGGEFWYDGASSATADGGTIFAPDSGSGRWKRVDTNQPNILWFGADKTGTNSCTAAYNLALTYMRTRGTNSGGVLFFPQGTYKFNTKPDIVTHGVIIAGEGKAKTYLYRNYTEATATEAFIRMEVSNGVANAGGGVRGVGIYADTGTTGGCAISLKSSSTVGQGENTLQEIYISGAGTWSYGIYIDGTLKTAAPVGVRFVAIHDVSIFQTLTEGIYCDSGLMISITSTGVFSTGGGSNQGLTLTGNATVPSENCIADMSFCSGVRIAPSTGYASRCNVRVASTVADLTTGTNLVNSIFIGNYTTHTNSSSAAQLSIVGLGSAAVSRIPGYLSLNGADGTYRVEAKNDAVTAYRQSSSVTKIGSAGAAYVTACPNGQTFTFNPSSAKLFHISTGGGAGALVFCDYKQTTISILSDPSSEFQASAAPASGKTGIYKSANAHAVSIYNNTGGAANYSILALGVVSSTTDPA